MKTIYFIIASVALLLVSCSKDEHLKAQEPIVEGAPATLELNIRQEISARSGMSKTQEQKINNLFVLVFDKSGVKVSQNYFASGVGSTISGIVTRSGADMSIYVVANLTAQNTGGNPSLYFNDIYTIAQLNSKVISNLPTDLNVNRSLVMYGSASSVAIPSIGTKQVAIQLYYPVSKVTLYVIKELAVAADSYTLSNWTVINYPLKSYLLPQINDAVNPAVSADFANSATSVTWVDTTITVDGTNKAAKYAFLYMFENRRGTNSNTLPIQKAINAPAKATAMVLKGFYQTAATNEVKGITTTLYLGNNNYNDYNVNRGREYSYIATIRGINNVDLVDSRVTSNDEGNQISLFTTTLDCHPDRRPLQITSWPGKSIVALFNTDKLTPCTWLHLSTKNINKAVNNLRPTYIPAIDMVNSLTLTFADLPTLAMTKQMLYIYADENLSTIPRSAYAIITSIEGITAGQKTTILLTQNGYQTMGNVGFRSLSTTGTVNLTDDYILAVENTEEAALNLTPGALPGTESTTTMQWGFNLTIAEPTASAKGDYYYRNGFLNTLWLVYQNTTGALNSTLRAPFGRLSASRTTTPSVTITEDAMHHIFNTYPARYCFEKNRDLDGDGKITNPNTLGTNEINWYLPSAEELYATYVGQYALPNALTPVRYQVSSELYGNNSSTNSMNYGTGGSGAVSKYSALNVRCVRRVYQPQPQTTRNSPYVETNSRIINNTGYAANILRAQNLARPVVMNSQNSDINNKISRRFQIAIKDCIFKRDNKPETMTWAQACGWESENNGTSYVEVIASPATGCNAYNEIGAPAGTWRLPTQREMYIILFMRKELTVGLEGFTKMAEIGYWTATNAGDNLAWYSITNSNTIVFGNKLADFSARCIRDL